MNFEPRLIRIKDAARIAGVSPFVFNAALSAGEIPIEMVRIGKTNFVKSADLETWLAPKFAPVDDLFK